MASKEDSAHGFGPQHSGHVLQLSDDNGGAWMSSETDLDRYQDMRHRGPVPAYDFVPPASDCCAAADDPHESAAVPRGGDPNPRPPSIYVDSAYVGGSAVPSLPPPASSEPPARRRLRLALIVLCVLAVIVAIIIAAYAVYHSSESSSSSSAAQTSASQAQSSTADFSRQLLAMNATIIALQQQISELKLNSSASKADFQQQISELRLNHSATTAGLQQRLDAASSISDAMNHTLGGMIAQLMQNTSADHATITALQQQATATNTIVTNIVIQQSQAADYNVSITALNTSQTDAVAAIARLQGQLAGANATIIGLQAQLTAATTTIAALQAGQAALNQSQTSLQSSISTTTTAMQGSLSGLAATTSALQASAALVPVKGILIWAGTPVTIPVNYTLCDGRTVNGIDTPDLRSRFVVGASMTSASPGRNLTGYTVNTQGGEEMHTLTIAEMPSHAHGSNFVATHSGTFMYSSWGNMGVTNPIQSLTADWGGNNGGTGAVSLTSYVGGTSTVQSTSPGAASPHNTLPPYYALAYIMRYQ
eukprot:m.243361 g.243361  ORF g.243361 m.243361 type:complete len:537 (-) comp14224_c0_seq1:249-1859(-)